MLTKEEYESLPEKARGAFAAEGDVYVPAKDAKLKQTLNELDIKYKEASSKLSEYEKTQAERQAEAERKALEKLKSEGKVDEIVADLERRHGESQRQFQERIDKMANQIRSEKRNALVADLASEMASEKGVSAFKRLVSSRIDVDPETGKVTFLNDDGSASSLDLAGFKAELLKDESLEPVLKSGIVTSGAGMVGGNTGGGASVKTMKRAAFENLNPAQKMQFTKDGGRVTE